MGLFDKGNPKKPAATSTQVNKPVERTVAVSQRVTHLGAEILIEGTVHAKEDIVIAGTIKGEIVSEKNITVEKTGMVEAKISCHSITVEGEVVGNINANDQVTIESDGKVTGDIRARVFSNQPGGFFEGYSHMIGLDQAKATEPSKPKPKPKGPPENGKKADSSKQKDGKSNSHERGET